MNSPVTQIKERLSIEEVVSSYIKLERAGANLKARCPFHNEKTPSFFISPDRGSFYCFGCGAKGDIFTFVEEFEGLDFKGALKILAHKAGVSLKDFNVEKEGEKDRLYKAIEEASLFFENNLSKNEKAISYLKERGLSDKTIKEFRIGFIPNEWRMLREHLLKKGFKNVELEKAGLVKKVEKNDSKGESYYDRFRGRIMFPISDSSGRIIAFSGRIFEDDGKSAKYLNSPETPIFSKSSVLYGLDKAKDSIRKNNFSILVEGQMDLVLSHQAGYKNTVATSGTALSDSTISKDNAVSNLGLLRRLSNNIVLAFDADRAGFNAAERAAKIALSFDMDVKVVALPLGVDPADLISQKGNDAWRNVIRESKHIIEFVLGKIVAENKEDIRKIGREVKDKVLPYVGALGSAIEQAHFLQKISAVSLVKEEALREDLSKIKSDIKNEKEETQMVEKKEENIFRKDYIERRLLGIYFWQKGINRPTIDILFLESELSKVFDLKIEDLVKKNEIDINDLIFEAEVFYENKSDLTKEIEELLRNLKEENLKEKLFKKMQDLQNYENKKDLENSRRTLEEINEINKEIQNIKSNYQK